MDRPNKYVPVLRWKQAERIAIRELYPQDKNVITPLIEFVPKDFAPDRIKKI